MELGYEAGTVSEVRAILEARSTVSYGQQMAQRMAAEVEEAEREYRKELATLHGFVVSAALSDLPGTPEAIVRAAELMADAKAKWIVKRDHFQRLFPAWGSAA